MEAKISPESFCYWLQGFFELQDPQTITAEQTAMIKEHLALCFNKVTTPKKELKNILEIKEGLNFEKVPFNPEDFKDHPFFPQGRNKLIC